VTVRPVVFSRCCLHYPNPMVVSSPLLCIPIVSRDRSTLTCLCSASLLVPASPLSFNPRVSLVCLTQRGLDVTPDADRLLIPHSRARLLSLCEFPSVRHFLMFSGYFLTSLFRCSESNGFLRVRLSFDAVDPFPPQFTLLKIPISGYKGVF